MFLAKRIANCPSFEHRVEEVFMEQETEYLRQVMTENKAKMEPLLRYLPWLKDATDRSSVTTYNSDGLGETSVPFPVYDSTLMAFIRTAQGSGLMDRNYPYVYTRKGLKTHDDERKLIENADWRSWNDVMGILSKYVLGGQTRSTLWSEGVSERIFYLTVQKLKDIIDYWTLGINA
jgi:hypothetical protein